MKAKLVWSFSGEGALKTAGIKTVYWLKELKGKIAELIGECNGIY